MNKKSLWQILWDYDPNGLLVVTPELLVTVVNPAFCSMFRISEQNILGYHLGKWFDDISDFKKAWSEKIIIPAEKKNYERYNLFVRRLIFPVPEEQVIAAIFVNLTTEWEQAQQLELMKQRIIGEVNSVIQEQTHVVQSIAQLLGETTAKANISLQHLIKLINSDTL